MATEYSELDLKECIPHIFLLDDQYNQVEVLEERLRAEGFLVRYFDDPDDMLSELDSTYVQLLLVDVALRGEGDTFGLAIGEKCASAFPETSRITISRLSERSEHSVQGQEIIKAMNPKPDLQGRRIFDAFGDKFDLDEMVALVRHSRKLVVSSDQVRFYVDNELEESLESVLASRVLNPNDRAPNVLRQFVEVTKQLTRSPSMPPASSILVSRVGKGRSRTIVCSVSVYFGENDVPRTFIAKVGTLQSIDQEVANYQKYLPQFIDHGKHPSLLALGRSRNLAGLAYGRLGGDEAGRPAPSLYDLYVEGKTGDGDLLRRIPRLFEQLLPHRGAENKDTRLLLEGYGKRFRILNRDSWPRLFGKYNSSLGIFLEHSLGVLERAGKQVKFGPANNRPLMVLEECLSHGYTPWGKCRNAVVHGDLHLDNILLPEGGNSEHYFIDFAHTEEHHLFLDYIIFEMACRYQIGLWLLSKDKIETNLLEELVLLEWTLCEQSFDMDIRDLPVRRSLRRVYDLICAVRREAARRAPKTEHATYLAGLGLATAAGTDLNLQGLPDELQRLLHSWFGMCSTLNLNAYESAARYTAGKSPKGERWTTVDLWSFSAEENEDQRLHASLDLLAPRMELELRNWMKSNEQRHEDLLDHLASISADVDLVKNHLDVTFPESASTLSSLLEQETNESDFQSKVVFGLGLPFLMLQIEHEVELPSQVENALSILRRTLGFKRVKN